MNLKKAFVFILLALLLANAVNAAEDLNADGEHSIDAINQNAISESDISSLNNQDIEKEDASNELTVSSDNKDTGEGLDEVNDKINISFSEQMYKEDLEDIDVEVSDDISGELCIMIDDETIYNESITETHFKVPVILPQRNFEVIANVWPIIDCTSYKVSAFLNGEDLKLNRTLKIMKLPPDFNYLNFQEEVLSSEKYQMFVFPRSSNGIVEIWLDDVLINKTKARPIIYFDNMNFTLGNHSWKVLFYNDSYYHDVIKTANFTVVNVKIDIPQIVNISHDDCISVETIYKSGNVKAYIDGQMICNSKMTDGYFVLSLEKYIKKDSREVKVVYENGKIKREKTVQVSVSYDFDFVSSDYFTYGEDNIIDVILPDTLNNKLLNVAINGTRYGFARPDYSGNNWIEINISKLRAGNYSLHMSYAGDDRFEAKEKIFNFSVHYNILVPYYFEYKDASSIYLNLPSDACGNLIVYVDGKIFGNASLKNGFAKVRVDSLAPGSHQIHAEYTGSDYEVEANDNIIYAGGRLKVSYSFTAGQDKYISYEMPKSAGGYVIFTINGKEHKVNVANGTARYSLKGLKAGEYEISIDYYLNGECLAGDYAVIEVKKSKIQIVSYKIGSKSVKVKIKLNKPMKSTVYVKINGKTYKIKTNSKGVGTFKRNLKVKKSKIKIKFSHLGSTLSKKLYKPNLKVAKSKKKITLKTIVNVKGAKVIFKVGKKKYTRKANAKGVAKISVKKPKSKRVVCKAIYFGCKAVKKVKI